MRETVKKSQGNDTLLSLPLWTRELQAEWTYCIGLSLVGSLLPLCDDNNLPTDVHCMCFAQFLSQMEAFPEMKDLMYFVP